MRKTVAFLLALLVLAGFPPCAGAEEKKEPFFEMAEVMTFYHYSSFVLMEGYEFGREYPFFELKGHGYGLPAFSTPDELVHAVFVPDRFGEKMIQIQLIGYDSSFEDERNLELLYLHTVGFLYLYTPEAREQNLDTATFKEAYFAMLYETMEKTPPATSASIRYLDVAEISVYRRDETMGVIVNFTQPITRELLSKRVWLYNLEEEEEE